MDNYNYSSLHLTTDLLSPEQKDATRISNAFRALAHIQQQKGQTGKAIQSLLNAEKIQPLNYPVYRDHASLLNTTKAGSDAWLQLNQSLCSNMVPKYPECASTLARSFVYPEFAKYGVTPEQQEAALSLFWQSIIARGPERWNVQEMVEKQIDMLNKCNKKTAAENTCTVFGSMIKNTISREHYSSYALECGNNLLKKMAENEKHRILAIMTEAITSGENMSAEDKVNALASAVLTTESLRDTSSFQAVSKLIDADHAHQNRPIGDFEAFAGQLVSEGGMVFASSTSRWDKPASHANVLTKLGGQIHTNRDKDAWIAVKLPKFATINGVVIVPHTDRSNWHRYKGLQLQISETGKDDDWHNVGQPISGCTERLIRFDLSSTQPKALYVRIIRPGTQDVLHTDGFFVYGTPAA